MYLVLTAMLALNVSAEIINAFFMLDKGIKKNNQIVEASVTSVIESMAETAKTKTQYQPLVEKAKEAKNITVGFNTFVTGLRERMVEESGGAYTAEEAESQGHPELAGKPIGKKDKDTPQRIFVSGDYGSEKKEPQGQILAAEIKKLKQAYLDFVGGLWDNGGIKGTIFADKNKKDETLKRLESEMTLVADEKYNPEQHEGKSWEEFTFGHMPVAAIYPMLRKFQNDARTSEAAVINFLASQMGKMELTYDKFDVFSQSSKPYILLGEKYESEIALGAYSSQADFSVSVGGSRLNVVDGKAKYTASGSSVGEKKYTATISVKNPQTGEVETFKKEFSYEVGQPSVNVAADKMNVFYVGVDNPVTVAAAGITTSAMKVSMTGGTLKSKGKTSYIVTAKKPGEATITVTDTKNGKKFPFKFRVKRIPDPIVKLGKKVDGLMGSGEFKAQPGLAAWLENFDFDARCQVQSYTMYYTRKRQDAVELKGKGGRFSGQIASAVRQAKPGDQYAFTDVKARCPGDSAGRRVNGLTFKIR
ncbi:GldM family protein [Aureispira sp. CCB-E]|nr:GldM family protein [Aureispira sp. CCB-E]WMX15587.1 GldM family protein [Aureispira sp. CCB-E]